jgi:RHS repeat-associated protein
VLSASDYYAFGMEMPGRTWQNTQASSYRYGFNGKERENDFWGDGNAYDFGARINDVRLGRWLSLDPLAAKYAQESNYIFAGNSPMAFVDIGGKYKYPAGKETEYANKYPKLTKLLSQEIKAYLGKGTEYRDGLKALGAFTDTQLDQLSEFGTSGLLEVEVVELDVENKPCSEVNGYTPKGGGKLQLDTDLIYQLERSSPKLLNNDKS